MVNLVSLLAYFGLNMAVINLEPTGSQLLLANESAPFSRVQRTDSVSVQSLVSTPLWQDGMDQIESIMSLQSRVG